jgi:hypothetical protein
VLKAGTDRRSGVQDLDALLVYLKTPAERAPIAASRMTRKP